ncbi:MAG: hypothetical protein JWO05_1115 [Gemmatimonadetes bacterium]|nr:hypothetical protein [Gemmatimonadota bacterium]
MTQPGSVASGAGVLEAHERYRQVLRYSANTARIAMLELLQECTTAEARIAATRATAQRALNRLEDVLAGINEQWRSLPACPALPDPAVPADGALS